MIAVTVPIEHGDDVAGPRSNFGQAACQPPDALAKLPVRAPPQVPIDDLLVRRVDQRIVQEMLDQKRILIRCWRKRDEIVRHGAPHGSKEKQPTITIDSHIALIVIKVRFPANLKPYAGCFLQADLAALLEPDAPPRGRATPGLR